ncbi:MAG: hypothetical protein K9W46_02295 [Candidatus Heimdallarchaeum endolithica]|uniref:Uncharacterized protein n=1 Tax=Candidatus Heimdallarchaeum endolithica TaxID=2876572 RepID=A0A9Y1FNR6_9ARCH|nr:MAG: hypothetical protein K9W46_02295 [Candidatus Heimdallarchaeum endolithica]
MSNLHISVVGGENIDKSTLLFKLAEEKEYSNIFDQHVQQYDEIGFTPMSISFKIENKYVPLVFYEMNSLSRYKYIRTIYFKRANAFILIYDLTNRQSFEIMKNLYFSSVKRKREEKNIPCFLLANKKDKEKEREVSFKEGERFAKEESINKFYEVSSNNSFVSIFDEFAKYIFYSIKQK